MTRINVGVNPKYLTDQHLIAEIKEIPQLLGQLTRSLEAGTATYNIPSEFTLGKGHVKFFYNKLLYLKERFKSLKLEAQNRGFNIEVSIKIKHYPDWCKGHYKERRIDSEIIRERIGSKLSSNLDFYRYKRKPSIPVFVTNYYEL